MIKRISLQWLLVALEIPTVIKHIHVIIGDILDVYED